jgi:ATP-dependent protease ClpP protease subunit
MRKIFAVAALASAACAGVARGDMLVGKNGLILDGKIVSRDAGSISFQSETGGAMQINPANVARVIVADEHGAVLQEPGTSKPADPATWNIPPEPAAPPLVRAQPGKPSYYLIPLHGEVGATFLAWALEKSLADAVARKPSVIVLDIDSPGGLVEEARRIIKVIHKYNRKARIVALVDKDLSAAAILTLSVKEIYVKSSGTIGAATSFVPDKQLSAKVEEKMQSAWRASARNSAEEGGHEPLLAEAMIDNDFQLHLEKVDGKPAVKEGPGEHVLCRKGKILTLTSHEAVECGLANAVTDDLDELADVLKMPGWTECKGLGTLLAEYLPRRDAAVKARSRSIFAQYEQNMVRARQTAPSDEVSQTVVRHNADRLSMAGSSGVYQPGQTTVETRVSHAHWRSRSLSCVVALQQAEANLDEEVALLSTFGHDGAAEIVQGLLTDISALRARIYDDRNRFGQNPAAAEPERRQVDAAPPPAAPPPAPSSRSRRSQWGPPPGMGEFVLPEWACVTGTVTTGHGGTGFYAVNAYNPVIGVWCRVTNISDKTAVQFITPLFQPSGPAPLGTVQVLAKDGYVVVGAAIASDQTSVVAVQLIFARLHGRHIDLRDSYRSQWIGSPDGATVKQVDPLADVIVIGFLGRRTSVVNSLSLVVAPLGAGQ